MIDLHLHLLPGLDDGPTSLEEAIEMARALTEAGSTAAAPTPHIDHKHEVEPLALAARREALRSALADAGVALELHAGGELAMTRAMELSSEELDAIRLGGGPFVLLECPFVPMLDTFERTIYELRSSGAEVLLGHPERSPAFLGDMAALEREVERGALVQVTASSFSGVFGQTVRRFSIELARRGLVHVVASDAHDAHRRGPEIREHLAALPRECGVPEAELDWMTVDVPAAILAGGALPERPERPPRRRRLFRRITS